MDKAKDIIACRMALIAVSPLLSPVLPVATSVATGLLHTLPTGEHQGVHPGDSDATNHDQTFRHLL